MPDEKGKRHCTITLRPIMSSTDAEFACRYDPQLPFASIIAAFILYRFHTERQSL